MRGGGEGAHTSGAAAHSEPRSGEAALELIRSLAQLARRGTTPPEEAPGEVALLLDLPLAGATPGGAKLIAKPVARTRSEPRR